MGWKDSFSRNILRLLKSHSISKKYLDKIDAGLNYTPSSTDNFSRTFRS